MLSMPSDCANLQDSSRCSLKHYVGHLYTYDIPVSTVCIALDGNIRDVWYSY